MFCDCWFLTTTPYRNFDDTTKLAIESRPPFARQRRPTWKKVAHLLISLRRHHTTRPKQNNRSNSNGASVRYVWKISRPMRLFHGVLTIRPPASTSSITNALKYVYIVFLASSKASPGYIAHLLSLQEWLLRSPHCPYCRETVIPIDNVPNAKVDKLTLIEMSKRRSTKTGSSFCCLEHGLVRIRRPLKLKRKMRELVDEVMACRVVEPELVAKRGGRLGNETESQDSEVSSIILDGTETTELHQSNVLSSTFNLSDLEIVNATDQQETSQSVECDLRGVAHDV